MQKSNEKNALLIKIMRSSVLQVLTVIILSGMACARPDFAQNVLNKRITLNLKNVALKEALDNIRDKAGVKFVYSSSLVPWGIR